MSQYDFNQPRMGQKDFDQSANQSVPPMVAKLAVFSLPFLFFCLTTTGAKSGQPHIRPRGHTRLI